MQNKAKLNKPQKTKNLPPFFITNIYLEIKESLER